MRNTLPLLEIKEMMDSETLALIPRVLIARHINQLDLTGGAPEMHEGFRHLVVEAIKLKIAGGAIAVADHCFGCTAGQGSSCGGAL